MAKYGFKKDTDERQMFIDYWDLCQNYWIPEESDDYWHNLIKDTDEFARRYKKIKLAVRLVVALVETKELERNIMRKGVYEG